MWKLILFVSLFSTAAAYAAADAFAAAADTFAAAADASAAAAAEKGIPI